MNDCCYNMRVVNCQGSNELVVVKHSVISQRGVPCVDPTASTYELLAGHCATYGFVGQVGVEPGLEVLIPLSPAAATIVTPCTASF